MDRSDQIGSGPLWVDMPLNKWQITSNPKMFFSILIKTKAIENH